MPRKTKDVVDESKVPLTQPVETPKHPHAEFEYEFGEMRRCHLCDVTDNHLKHEAEQVWFATLEDRARHILECHQEIRIEVQRAKEVLGIAELWDSKAESKPATFKIPIIGDLVKPSEAKEAKVKKPDSQQSSWFARNKILTLLLLGGIIYLLIVLYRLSQGYTF